MSGVVATTDTITVTPSGRSTHTDRRLGHSEVRVRTGVALLGLVAGACLVALLLPEGAAGTLGEALAAGAPELIVVATVVITAAPVGFLVGVSTARGGRGGRAVVRAGAYTLSCLPLTAVLVAAESQLFRVEGNALGIIALAAALAWIPVARRVERSTLPVLATGHVRHALAVGASRPTLMRRHILPVVGRDAVGATLLTAVAALAVVACTGFVQASESWGGLLGELVGTPPGDLLGDLSFWAPLLLLAVTTGALLLVTSGLSQADRVAPPHGGVAAAPPETHPGEVLALIGLSRADALEMARDSVLLDLSRTALRPNTPIGRQLVETVVSTQACQKADASIRVRAALADLGVPDPDPALAALPCDLPAPMLATIVLAATFAAAGTRVWVLADAPELGVRGANDILTALVTRYDPRAAVTIVTADVGTAARHADCVGIYESGRLVEAGKVGDVLRRPGSPFTAALVAAAPDLARDLRPDGPAPTETPAPPAYRPAHDRSSA